MNKQQSNISSIKICDNQNIQQKSPKIQEEPLSIEKIDFDIDRYENEINNQNQNIEYSQQCLKANQTKQEEVIEQENLTQQNNEKLKQNSFNFDQADSAIKTNITQINPKQNLLEKDLNITSNINGQKKLSQQFKHVYVESSPIIMNMSDLGGYRKSSGNKIPQHFRQQLNMQKRIGQKAYKDSQYSINAKRRNGKYVQKILSTVKVLRIGQTWLFKIPSRKLKNLSKKSFNYVGDKLLFNEQKQEKYNMTRKKPGCVEQCIVNFIPNCILNFLEMLPIIDHTSQKYLFYDILMSLLTIYLFIFIPLELNFKFLYYENIEDNLNKSEFFFLKVLVILLHISQIIIKFNVPYFQKGTLITNRFQISVTYIQHTLILDLINLCILIDIYILSISEQTDGIYKYYILLYFSKIKDLQGTVTKLKERFYLSQNLHYVYKLIRLLVTVLMIGHLFGCVWIEAAKIQQRNGIYDNWMSQPNDIQNKEWYQQYLNALYFSTVTMVTVGYGDILPQTDLEIILCIFTMLIACGVFGYTMNSIGQILQEMNQDKTLINQKIYALNNFMHKKKINYKMQLQVREYIQFYLQETISNDSQLEQTAINQLSKGLRNQLLLESNKIILKDSPIFKNNFSSKIIENTIPIIKEKKLRPDEILQKKGDQDSQNVYFIQKGRLQIYIDENIPKTQKLNINAYEQSKFHTIKVLNDGDSFGEYEFFTQQEAQYSIKSLEFSSLLYISNEDFLQLIKNSEDDFERYCHIRDKLIFTKNNKYLGKFCFACQDIYHDFIRCPSIHYNPNKIQVIYRAMVYEETDRKRWFRTQQKYNCLDNLTDVYDTADYIMDKLMEFLTVQTWKNIFNDNTDYGEEYYNPEDRELMRVLFMGESIDEEYSAYTAETPKSSNYLIQTSKQPLSYQRQVSGFTKQMSNMSQLYGKQYSGILKNGPQFRNSNLHQSQDFHSLDEDEYSDEESLFSSISPSNIQTAQVNSKHLEFKQDTFQTPAADTNKSGKQNKGQIFKYPSKQNSQDLDQMVIQNSQRKISQGKIHKNGSQLTINSNRNIQQPQEVGNNNNFTQACKQVGIYKDLSVNAKKSSSQIIVSNLDFGDDNNQFNSNINNQIETQSQHDKKVKSKTQFLQQQQPQNTLNALTPSKRQSNFQSPSMGATVNQKNIINININNSEQQVNFQSSLAPGDEQEDDSIDTIKSPNTSNFYSNLKQTQISNRNRPLKYNTRLKRKSQNNSHQSNAINMSNGKIKLTEEQELLQSQFNKRRQKLRKASVVSEIKKLKKNNYSNNNYNSFNKLGTGNVTDMMASQQTYKTNNNTTMSKPNIWKDDLDIIKIYRNYFPYHNYRIVVAKIRRKQKQDMLYSNQESRVTTKKNLTYFSKQKNSPVITQISSQIL